MSHPSLVSLPMALVQLAPPVVSRAVLRRTLCLLLAGLAIAGAGARRAGAQYNNCLPPVGRGSPVGSPDSLRGSLLLVAYSTTGPQRGRMTSGTLDLSAAPAEMRSAGVLLVGSTTIELARVGGAFAGSMRSRDPATPAVTVERAVGRDGVTMTFGSVRLRDASGALRSPVTRFEVVERYAKGYRGSWRTVGSTAAASGYFCLSRF